MEIAIGAASVVIIEIVVFVIVCVRHMKRKGPQLDPSETLS